jgi:hypothetical protein
MERFLLTMVAAAVLRVVAFAQATPPGGATLAQQIASEIAQVHGGTNPLTWLQTHPDEKLRLYNGRQLKNDTEKWCARTVVAHPVTSGRAWTRAVYFYDPQPPKDDVLPAPGTPPQEVLQTTCELGLVWIEIPETSVTTGAELVKDIEAALALQYGTGATPRLADGFGSAGWTEVRQWKVKGGVLTAAYDQFAGKGHRALVRMAFSNSDAIHDLPKETQQSRVELLGWRDGVIRRIKQAAMPTTATLEMLALLEKPDFFNGRNKPAETQVLAAFRNWITAANSQPAGKRARALLAADCALDFLDHNGVGLGDAARAQMKEFGAGYVQNELAGGPVYIHGLLKQAKAIAPPGYVADEVLLLEMERGFDETGACSAGVEEFSQVIQQGESLLMGSRALPPETLSSLHFMVGDAYATIVWLAETTDTEYHDPKKYQPAAASARAKALEHYRAALALEHGTQRAHKAWGEAWRLGVGLTPTSGRYFCVYD